MPATTLFRSDAVTVLDYRCSFGPQDAPYAESHDRYSVAYVRKGSFGLRARGRRAATLRADGTGRAWAGRRGTAQRPGIR